MLCEKGGVAQLVERPFCTRKVSGSNPLASTILCDPLILSFSKDVWQPVKIGCVVCASIFARIGCNMRNSATKSLKKS